MRLWIPVIKRLRAAQFWTAARGSALVWTAVLWIPLASCAAKQGVVSSNQQFAGERYAANRAMTEADKVVIVDAMSIAAEGTRGFPLVQAVGMMAWEDVPAAAESGARLAEMAVAGRERQGDVWFFTIRTLDDVPGVLRVERKPPPECVLVTASIGRFDQRREQADALVASFMSQLQAYGKKYRPMTDEMRLASMCKVEPSPAGGNGEGGGDKPLEEPAGDPK